MARFAMTGAAGYVAKRHIEAIKKTGNELIACFDPHDSVGTLDQYFPKCFYFSNYERFERFLSKNMNDNVNSIDYLTVCSPNYIHDTHIRLGLGIHADVICEKPLVLFPENLDLLEKLERDSGKRIYTVMQLRYHPSLINLKSKIDSEKNKKHNVQLSYITARGNWYHYSWKGDEEKSGGIATNIGIHLFDLLIWLFGKVNKVEVHSKEKNKMSGNFELQNAEVSWILSIDDNDLPIEISNSGKSTYRSIKIDGQEIEFSEGFSDLHTKVYSEVLEGRGLRISDARPSIEVVHEIRFAKINEKKYFKL